MIDLHVHSTASDGLIPPGELPAMAAKIGLTAVALTDHDTVDGVAEFMKAAEAYPQVMAIPGVELSVQYCSRELHFVGLFVDPENETLGEYLAAQRQERAERAERMQRFAEELLFTLRFNVNEELALRDFALRTAMGG